MPMKDPMRSAPARIDEPVRRKLEALREDCRRHREQPVRFVHRLVPCSDAGCREWRALVPAATSPPPVHWCEPAGTSHWAHAVLESDEPLSQTRALALLERLGKLAPRLSERAPGWVGDRRSAWVAGGVMLCEREGRAVRVPIAEPIVSKRADGVPSITVNPKPSVELLELSVLDVLAAIAEVCDAILGGTPGAIEVPPKRRRSKEELFQEAMLELVRCGMKGETPSDAEIAAALGVARSTFSEQVASDRKWKDARAATRRKPGPEAEDSEEIDRSEADKPNAEPNLGPAIVRRKARS